MSAQGIVVAIVVFGCCMQAAWALLPAAARRGLAGWMARSLPLPSAWTARLALAARVTSGCGCDGCDRSGLAGATEPAAAASPTTQPITFHRRPQR